MQMRSADAGEAKRTNSKKKEKTQLKKATLKGAKNRHAKTCKKTTNQTRGQLDKHDFGKKLKTWAKSKKKEKKKQIRPGTSWTNMISGKSCKSLGKCKKKRKKTNKTKAKKKRKNNNAKKKRTKSKSDQ